MCIYLPLEAGYKLVFEPYHNKKGIIHAYYWSKNIYAQICFYTTIINYMIYAGNNKATQNITSI